MILLVRQIIKFHSILLTSGCPYSQDTSFLSKENKFEKNEFEIEIYNIQRLPKYIICCIYAYVDSCIVYV